MQPYNIFISSPFRDLEEARAECVRQVTDLGLIPITLESVPPGVSRPQEILNSQIQLADAFIVLVGARYGAPSPESATRSFTEWETNLAVGTGKPILTFLMTESEVTSARSGFSDDDPERQSKDRLESFRARLEALGPVEYFSMQDLPDLGHKIALKLATLIGRLEGKESTKDRKKLRIVFSEHLDAKQVSGTLSALADYYRACGGLGLEIDLEFQNVAEGAIAHV